MYSSTRSKVGILLSLITIVGILGALVMTTVSRGPTTHATSSSTVFHGTHSTATSVRRAQLTKFPSGSPSHTYDPSNPPPKHIADTFIRKLHGTGAGAPHVSSSLTIRKPVHATDVRRTRPNVPGALLHTFNGLSDLDSNSVNGFVLEPPDQGLCVGTFFGTAVTVEIVNEVVVSYDANGTPLSTPASLASFFGDSTNNLSDPRCYFDASTQTFLFTVLAYNFGTPSSQLDIVGIRSNGTEFSAVINMSDVTNTNCPCLGDQPHLGIDQNNVYISVDEFGFASGYNGAALYAISKSQLIAGGTVNIVGYNNLQLAGIPILTLQPAITTGPSVAEFMMNSFPIADSNFTPNPVDTNLGLWALTNGAAVTSGGFPNLVGTIISSVEAYGIPVTALSTNSTTLNPNDDRMQQVQAVNGALFGALDTAITATGDPVTRDGVAWFELIPSLSGNSPIVLAMLQGYIAVAGNYLLYPAIEITSTIAVAIVFTATGPGLNPSSAYVIRAAGSSVFAGIYAAAIGSGSYNTFANRWGDYSAAAVAPNGTDFWMATEYVPPVASQVNPANWGTSVFEVSGT